MLDCCSRLAALATVLASVVFMSLIPGYGGVKIINSHHLPYTKSEERRNCAAGVLDYLANDNVEAAAEPIIPHSTSCILEHLLGQGGGALTPPKSAKVVLKGVPVTGTTWTEIFVKHLLKEVCNSGLYGECHATGCDEDDAVMHHIPNNNQRSTEKNRICHIKFKEGQQIAFIPEGKHHPEMRGHVQCQPLKNETMKRQCQLLLRDATMAGPLAAIPARWRFQPDWVKQCLMSDEITYRRIPACLPEYVKLPRPRNPTQKTTGGRLQQQQEPHDHDDELTEDSFRTKYILIVRDPRDTAVSWASKQRISEDKDKVQLRICRKFSMWTAFFYFWHVKQLGSTTPTLELWYRSMKDDLRQEIKNVLAFLELRASEQIVNKILNASTFASMKERADNPASSTQPTSMAKLRKGSYGHFTEEMSSHTARNCSEFMRRILPQKHNLVFGMSV